MSAGAKPAPKPKLPTLVLAGNHQQFVEFLKGRGINPYIKQDNLGTRYYEGGGQVAGVHFDRIIVTGTFRQRPDARNLFEYSRACLAESGKVAYDDLEHGWYAGKWDTKGDPIMHDGEGVLRCNWCRSRCSETYHKGFCYLCGKGLFMPKKPMYGDGKVVPEWKLLPKSNATLANPVNTLKPTLVRKEGDIWKLPKSSSPMWTQQWGYQGSAKAPYIISRRDEGHANGSTTSDGWACSCMSFTRNTPRTPCKHILNVMLKYGLGVVQKATAKMANVGDAKLKEFEEWQRQQAALKKGNVPTSGAKLNLFGATTRKFR
jgi:hypothetical protein